jgi:hypothetical protein
MRGVGPAARPAADEHDLAPEVAGDDRLASCAALLGVGAERGQIDDCRSNIEACCDSLQRSAPKVATSEPAKMAPHEKVRKQFNCCVKGLALNNAPMPSYGQKR